MAPKAKQKENLKSLCIFCCISYRPHLSTNDTFRVLKLTNASNRKKFYKRRKKTEEYVVPLPSRSKKGSRVVHSHRYLICTDPNFREFCNLIESLSKKDKHNNGEGDDDDDEGFCTNHLLQSMAFYKVLAVCGPCLRRIKWWNEVRDRVLQREEEILRLQKQIIKELNALDQDLRPYQEHLEFIEEGIQKSDVDYLEQVLNEVTGKPIDSDGEGDEDLRGLNHKAPVISFRKHVLNAVGKIKSFRKRHSTRIDPSKRQRTMEPELGDEPASSACHSKEKAVNVIVPEAPSSSQDQDPCCSSAIAAMNLLVDNVDLVIKTEIESDGALQSDGEDGLSSSSQQSHVKSTVPEGQTSVDPCCSSSAAAAMDPATGENDPIIKTEIESDGAHQSESEAELPRYDDDANISKEIQDEDEVACSDSSSMSDDEYLEMKKGKRKGKRSRSHNRYNLRPTSEVDEYSSAWSDSDSDSDSDYQMESDSEEEPAPTGVDLIPKKKSRRERALKVVIPPAAKLEEQPEFTQEVLKKVYHRIALRNSDEHYDPIPKDDPRYEYFIDYDAVKQCLFVKHVNIIINNELRELQCSECDYSVGKPQNVLLVMLEHIMGKHLQVFKCLNCCKIFSRWSKLKEHEQFHDSPHLCDICGKALGSSKSLYRHKWSHMSADEVAQALAQGMKDPRVAEQERKQKRTVIVCPECGKCCQGRSGLKSHEEHCHSDRPKVQCFQCGKLLSEYSLDSHMKFYCANRNRDLDESMKKVCPMCPGRTFKNAILLNRHMKRVHGSPMEKNFVCNECGKAFSISSQLKLHERIKHLGEKWVCELGCGASFTWSSHRIRHQKASCPRRLAGLNKVEENVLR